MKPGDIQHAAQKAATWLLREGEDGFPEARHVMRFPKRFGFGGRSEEHASDVFARAVIALEIVHAAASPAGRDIPALQRLRTDVAPREADHAAAARLRDRAGGWSYFPSLPELPPDLDSLAAAVSLFALLAPHHLPLTEGPVALALEGVDAGGGRETWLISPGDGEAAMRRMRNGVARHFGRGTDVEVVARFYHALHLAHPVRYRRVLERGARFVAGRQRPDGAFDAGWYFGGICGTLLCVQFLAAVDCEAEARARALGFVTAAQRADGGFGLWESTPLETAAAIQALALLNAQDGETIARALARLLDFQAADGRFNASPWIRMDIGRPEGRVAKSLTHQSVTVSTAFCLRALAQAQSLRTEQCDQARALARGCG